MNSIKAGEMAGIIVIVTVLLVIGLIWCFGGVDLVLALGALGVALRMWKRVEKLANDRR